jgi:predicted RNA-binding Zn ribbon-like protein
MADVTDLRLVGGLACLDFINSLDWRASEEPVEYLRSFQDLLQWSVQTRILTPAQSGSLARLGSAASRAAALRRAVAFREASHRIVELVRSRRLPGPADVRLIESTINKARTRLSLVHEKETFRWTFADEEANLDLPLFKLALSLEELLTSPDLRLVRQCGGRGCGWLFLDSTKNHSRRWCSMDGCGNRAKARRFYDRYYR